MSSFPRTLQRRKMRAHPDYEPKPQVTIVNDDGSYLTLRPTKGWMFVSARRAAADMAAKHQEMAVRLNAITAAARTKKPSKVYRQQVSVPAGTETRQQRRAAARGYVTGVSA